MTAWRDPLPGAPPATFWGSLRPDDREALAGAGTFHQLGAAETLCHENERVGRVFLVMTGGVEVFRDDGAGHRVVLAHRGPGDVIGELAAVDGGAASASVVTAGPATVLMVPAERFAALCQERPRLTWQVLAIAVARLRDSDTHRSRSRSDVRTRTIHLLLELAGDRPGAGPATLRIGQQNLADRASASLASVTRVLDELRRSGAVTTGRGRITVRPERLRAELD
ncbi:MAG TPA: Crp/Fnr family transcriptional regulator [Pseudonocardiaceae bacterium]